MRKFVDVTVAFFHSFRVHCAILNFNRIFFKRFQRCKHQGNVGYLISAVYIYYSYTQAYCATTEPMAPKPQAPVGARRPWLGFIITKATVSIILSRQPLHIPEQLYFIYYFFLFQLFELDHLNRRREKHNTKVYITVSQQQNISTLSFAFVKSRLNFLTVQKVILKK